LCGADNGLRPFDDCVSIIATGGKASLPLLGAVAVSSADGVSAPFLLPLPDETNGIRLHSSQISSHQLFL